MDMNKRFFGCMYGLAVGDAVGTTVEFKPRGSFHHVTDMVGGGPFSLEPGQWTDDTSMALCLAESLLECEGFDARNQIEKYQRWLKDGYLSSTGSCFDIGNTVLMALHNYEKTDNPFSGPSNKYSAGNGSIMRLAPVALLYSYDLRTCVKMCADSSRTTHQAKESIDGCELLAILIFRALQGIEKDKLLDKDYIESIKNELNLKWSPAINNIVDGAYKEKSIDEVEASGYVVHTLEAVLWAFYHSTDFKEGLLKVVNLGNDADTTGAVYGQLAGAFYGLQSIPEQWEKKLAMHDVLFGFTNDLLLFHQNLKKEYFLKEGIKKAEIIAQQGEGRYLLLLENEQGRILDLYDNVLFPPIFYQSILARGYWEDYTDKIDLTEALRKVKHLN